MRWRGEVPGLKMRMVWTVNSNYLNDVIGSERVSEMVMELVEE